ncbi:MAG: hypothetical protein J6Q30_06730 [Oscillospiraceae bacterium]|nr:hypothetical protein [Oscillospiraceae bacterium]
MEWLEANSIPEECNICTNEDCYNCDTAGKRWTLSREDELCLNRILAVRAIARLQRKVAEIDAELEKMRKSF